MKLEGQLGRSFGNFLTLRGLARMGDLEKISKADDGFDGFQRNLHKNHKSKMVAFLKDGQYTFYPELILMATMYEQDDDLENADEVYNTFLTKTYSKKFKSFQLTGRKHKSSNDFYRGILDIGSKSKKLSRIDGNHRLSATKAAGKQDEIVPFCIIFTRSQEEFEKTSRILFTNINYKQLPLTSEENYKIIFGKQKNGSDLYSDKELANPVFFGKHFLKAKKFLEKMSLDNLPRIKNILWGKGKSIYTRTAIVDFFNISPKEKGSPDDILFKVEEIYKKYPERYISKNYQLLVAHIYFFTKGEDYFKAFYNWVLENRIYELESVDIDGIIKLYERILDARERTIFLAMDFSTSTNRNFNAIRKAVDDINQEENLSSELKLEVLRIDGYNSGRSHSITKETLKHIKESGYLIADLTLGNKNVYHEIGYRMGLGKNNFLLVHNNRGNEENFKKDVGFNISDISIVRAKNSSCLRKKIKKQLKKYYGISQ